MSEKAQEEIVLVARKIADAQRAMQLPDTEMVARYAGLGSARTYRRMVDGEIVGKSNLETRLADYKAVLRMIDEEGTASREVPFLELSSVIDARVAVVEAMQATDNTRLVIVQGPSGAGKTTTLKHLEGMYGQAAVFVEAVDTWRASPRNMLGDMLRAIGVIEPTSVADRLTDALGALGRGKRLLLIDEAHHMGPGALNIIKTIINQCPRVVVVMAAMGTLFARLELAAYAEAMQLTHNRLHERIRLDQLDREDVAGMIRAGTGFDGDRLAGLSDLVATLADGRGHLKFVRRVITKARLLAGAGSVDEKILRRAAESVAAAM